MALQSTSRPNIRGRVVVRIPATLQGANGMTIEKEDGVWTVKPAFDTLTEILGSAVSNPTAKQIWLYDPDNDVYNVLTLSGLGDALFVGTSTTSLAIGIGSKTFTTQEGKNFDVGSFVLATSDADPTNYMLGQVTAYSSTSLTVNVTTIGGSGTLADWTLRASSPTGPTGDTGVTPGIRQAYSDTTTDGDPGDGTFRLNHATPASATAAYLDNLDDGGATVSSIIDLWDDSTNTVKGSLRAEKSATPTVWAEWEVTGSVVDGTGYRKLTLQNGAGSGAFTDGDTFAFVFTRSGDKGADGADGSIAGTTGSTDNALLRADGTGGAALQNSTLTLDDTGAITFPEMAAPATPASAKVALYAKADGRFYEKDDAGTERGLSSVGKHTIWVPATAMVQRATNGAMLNTIETTTNKNMAKTLDFDTTTQEFAQFEIAMPKGWNESTVTFQPVWSHASTTTNFGVVWALQGVARSDDDAMDVAFGTEQTSTDTGGTTNDLYIGPESSAITIGGTPAEGDVVQFQIKRNVSDGSDTLAVDARLHGVKLYVTLNAPTDD